MSDQQTGPGAAPVADISGGGARDTRTLVPYLKKLVRDPRDLHAEDIWEALDIILNSDAVPDVQISGFLIGARTVARDQEKDFILTAVRRLRRDARHVDPARLAHAGGYVDIVGTGGDGKNTFNVSTTAAIVAAGIGLPVAKHGGPASTSRSGASDLLVALGVDVTKINAESAPTFLNESKFTYLSAPQFHPVLSRTRTIRRNMGVPSIFNLVGPLLNPAPISSRIVGVYAQNLGPEFAEVINDLQRDGPYPKGEALVVWGTEGLDEISPAQETQYWHLKNGEITPGTLHPRDFGLPTHPLEDVASGTPEENAQMVFRIVDNQLPENHPILDYVLLNTAALAVVAGKAQDWKDGVRLARESITSGAARKALDTFVALSRK